MVKNTPPQTLLYSYRTELLFTYAFYSLLQFASPVRVYYVIYTFIQYLLFQFSLICSFLWQGTEARLSKGLKILAASFNSPAQQLYTATILILGICVTSNKVMTLSFSQVCFTECSNTHTLQFLAQINLSYGHEVRDSS